MTTGTGESGAPPDDVVKALGDDAVWCDKCPGWHHVRYHGPASQSKLARIDAKYPGSKDVIEGSHLRADVRLSPRDTWPEMRVTIVPLPWTWALVPRGYRDDVDGGLHGLATFSWLFLRLEWWGNRPLFTDAKASDIGGTR